MQGYYVEIIKYGESEETVEKIGPMSERKAERVDSGVNINLNHEEYYTIITSDSTIEDGN